MEKKLHKPSQVQKLTVLLRDRRWHPTTEIMRKVYGVAHSGICRIGARIADMKELGYEIDSKPWNETRTVWAYRVTDYRKPEAV